MAQTCPGTAPTVGGVQFVGCGEPYDNANPPANSYTAVLKDTPTIPSTESECKTACDGESDLKGFSFFVDSSNASNNKCTCWTGGGSDISTTEGTYGTNSEPGLGYTYCYGCLDPSSQPSLNPSVSTSPSLIPSESPSLSGGPSSIPSGGPSSIPSESPSVSANPSSLPSENPSVSYWPTSQPSENPSISGVPSSIPSESPSLSTNPSSQPSENPSVSNWPTSQPSMNPSISVVPSPQPTSSPTAAPTKNVSCCDAYT